MIKCVFLLLQIPTPPALIDKAARYIQQIQVRPKPQLKPAVVINLSTGLPEEPEFAQEVSPSKSETVSSSATVTPSAGTSSHMEDAENGEQKETVLDNDKMEDNDDDLMKLDLNVRLPAGISLADFSDVMTDDSDLKPDE